MENTNQNPPNLTLTDLQVLRNIVELAISRGAFKAEEITIVGQHYDKVNSWLAHVLSQTQQPTNQETTIEEPAQPKIAAKTARASSTKKSPAKQKGKK